jgi:mannitol-1-phosphate 5-dehydrogenase
MPKGTFVGFGFGPIQAGLFLYEAFASGAFDRLVVGYRRAEVIAAVRRSGGRVRVNIAHHDGIEPIEIGPVEIYDVTAKADRDALVEAVAEAGEIGVAVSSVADYVSPHPGSLHLILAAGLGRKAATSGPRAVVYAAENHNHAAEILEEGVLSEVAMAEHEAVRAQVCFLNTVIGKMSGVVSGDEAIRRRELVPITPELERAFLVEAYRRIYVSRPTFSEPYERGIRSFEEKEDLLPFEEAKLYGHNATHALAAYLALFFGLPHIADLKGVAGAMEFLHDAFLEESGAALVRKHAGLDPLFTLQGYRAYAEDLLERMTNPFLLDSAARVGRDPARKLGWDDRLVGTMRLALGQGIMPRRYAIGAAAALARLHPAVLDGADLPSLLIPLWQPSEPDALEQAQVIGLLREALVGLRRWQFEHTFPK